MSQRPMRFYPGDAVGADVIHAILETPAIVLPELAGDSTHTRTHDDHDGEWTGKIVVTQDCMGDMFVQTSGNSPWSMLRFRNGMGGTNSPRVHNAVKILAEAIRLDNLDRPEPPK